MANEYDLIILGGGCAGLSLATQLTQYGSGAPRTLVLESRGDYHNDRTWCFWQLPGTAQIELVENRWPAFRVASNDVDFLVDCSSLPYCVIPALRFYQHSLALIGNDPSVSLLRLAPVVKPVTRTRDQWIVETPYGIFRARNVVDTRPVRTPRQGDALLWQSFLGAEIELAREHFSTREVTLMDFRRCPKQRMVFTYILPFSTTRALIEVTEFSPLALPPADLQPLLNEAIAETTGGLPFRALRTESGLLPMAQATPPHAIRSIHAETASYVHAGVAGGGARACTGYAFQRIQRWAGLCAAHLVEKDLPLGHPRDPHAVAFLDYLFLRVLRDDPDLAPSLFTQLFAEAPTGSVLRFLGDRASPADLFHVIASLEPRPFLKAMLAFCANPAIAWREAFVS
jgi:lycopene beta-cyclase